ncbi:PAS domain-containing protein [Methylobacterium komagatae]
MPDALSASQVGVWETDFQNDLTFGDATLAALFGVDRLGAANGLPLADYIRNVSLEDREMLFDRLNQVRLAGGMFVVEYRTHPTPDDVRWVLARGRYERDPRTGEMMGRGIVIDITDSKLDGQMSDRAIFVMPDRDEGALDRIASLAIMARREMAKKLGERESSPLRKAIDTLLWAVGRALAAAQTAQSDRKSRFN